jgi:pimeloyl-ACP methyl ester carboxylesterase
MMAWDRHEFTPAAGTRMHAALLGSDLSPPVVCVHGLGCSHRYFLPLAERLRQEAQVAAVDLPGFGWTPGPPLALDVAGMSRALADWLRATGRGGAVLVGDSTGCQAIADLAVRYPELVGPVVLAGPTFDRRHRGYSAQLVRLLLEAVVERPSPRLLAIRIADRRDSGMRRWVDTFRGCLRDPIERKLDQIKSPATVLRGARDPLVTERWAREVVDRLPAGRLVTVPKAGHTVNWAAPDRLAEVVREHLRVPMPEVGSEPRIRPRSEPLDQDPDHADGEDGAAGEHQRGGHPGRATLG